MEDDGTQRPDSLLPYEHWTEEALRQVVARAVAHAAVHGLPGQHHFYITFRTDHPGVVIPPRLRAQYPQEMTIVLQHQFWDLRMDDEAGLISVGLSFGGIASTLVIPLAALTAFADPQVRYGLRFNVALPDAKSEPEAPAATPPVPAPVKLAAPEKPPEKPAEVPDAPQVVSLDAFRRRTTPKE
jgi:hypothetical protein